VVFKKMFLMKMYFNISRCDFSQANINIQMDYLLALIEPISPAFSAGIKGKAGIALIE
jgi:hypothetical protein